MCGIAGLFSVNRILPVLEARDQVMRQMARVQAYRGPDDEGIWHDAEGRCSLAHRRLSIIDTSKAGHQPMLDASGRWVITFNGEIYNFVEVRAELEAMGVPFRGRTDTEVLLQAICTWGTDALPRLDGMFAFAAFDRESGQLLLARDAFGEKPLYYAELPGNGLAFASELHALEGVPGVDLTVSADSVAELLMFQYIGAPRTVYAKVNKLAPGHWMVASPGRPLRIERYFKFRPGEHGFDSRPIAQLADELEHLLIRSLRRRLISDVPLGAFLSGGVDSSTVCALIRGRLGVPLKTYSIGFAKAQESEHHTARLFAEHLGTEHHEKIVAPHASDFLQEIGGLLDEPNADSSCLPTYLLSAFARESVTVALSGDGGDEMFAGYGRYFHTIDDANLLERTSSPGWKAGDAYYSNRILVSTEQHIAELFGGVPPRAAEHLRRLRDSVSHGAAPLICRLRQTDVDNYLPGAVLPKVDRMSMQHSLEVRTPFLNVEVARFAERLPQDAMYADKIGKRVLREVAYRYLPRSLIDLPKQGFGVPMVSWAREELLNVAAKLLETDESRLRHSLGSDAVARFMNRQRAPDGFSTYQVWALAMLESWLRHHDPKVPSFRLDSPTSLVSGAKDGDLVGLEIKSGAYAVVRREALGGSPDDRDKLSGQVEIAAWQSGLLDVGSKRLNGALTRRRIEIPLSAEKIATDSNLKDCTLVLPATQTACDLDTGLLDAWRLAGVRQIVVPHPHRPPGAFIHYRFNRHRGVAGILTRLRLRRLAAVSWWGWSARHSHDGRLCLVGPFSQLTGPENTELSCRYAMFRGNRQLFPLPASHEQMAQARAERYSIWSRHCLYSGRGRRSTLSRYRVVEQTERTLEILPISTSVTEPRLDDFLQALRQKMREQPPVPHDSLGPTDRVVLITNSLQPGGAERQWCYLAIGLKERGVDVRFLVLDALEGSSAHYAPMLGRHGISPMEITDQASAKALTTVPSDPISLRLLRPYAGPFGLKLLNLTARLVELQPKAIFAQLDEVNLLAGVAAVVANISRCVLSFRNYNPTNFSYLHQDWFLPCYRALSESPRIVLSGNSRAANADYARWLDLREERVALIPNSIDTVDFDVPGAAELNRLRQDLGVSPSSPVVLGVFRLSEEKDPKTFLEVCASMAKKIPGLRAFVAGVGPLRGELEALIAARSLQDVVTLLGRRTDIPALMAISSLLLLTSTHEGMPNVAMEAQVFGLPVVATRTGGTPDIVLDGVTGYLRGAGDVSGLAEACISILADGEVAKRMASAARRQASQNFSRRNMVDRYLSLLSAPDASRSAGQATGFAREAV